MPQPLVSLLEGFFAGSLLREFRVGGALDKLRLPTSPAELAASLHVDEDAARACLEFLARATGTVTRARGGRYCLGRELLAPMGMAYVDKFLGAYGGAASRARAALQSRRGGAALVDRAALASAFREVRDPPLVVCFVRERVRTGILDLGCGTATLLATVCDRPSGPAGWGIEADAAMCNAARSRLKERGLMRRVRILRGDATRPTRLLRATERARVDVLHAASLFNALMRPRERAIRTLRSLRRAFPRRTLVNVDYLGVLCRGPSDPSRERGAALQDLVQVLSGQGIPPASHDEWALLYAAAGCRLTDVVESQTDGLRWFIHAVAL